MMAVGNVGEELAPYKESDTFFSRDAGFTWEEVHKDAHLWEYGDSGSILVMANDEQQTDRVLFSTDEGLSWHDYMFGEKMRVRSIVTVPSDTSRQFILFGAYARSPQASVAVHIDFSALTRKQCEQVGGHIGSSADWMLFKVFWMFTILKRMTLSYGVPVRNGKKDVSLAARYGFHTFFSQRCIIVMHRDRCCITGGSETVTATLAIKSER